MSIIPIVTGGRSQAAVEAENDRLREILGRIPWVLERIAERTSDQQTAILLRATAGEFRALSDGGRL